MEAEHILYESDRKTKIGTLKPNACSIKKTHMGSWYLEMEHNTDGIGSDINRDTYIKAPTPSGYQFFKVKMKDTLNENSIKVTAFHLMYNLANEYVKDTNIINKNRVDACKQILSNTLRKHDFTVEGHVGLDKLNNLRIVGYDPFNAIVGTGEDNTVVNRYKNTEWDFDNTKLIIEDTIGEDNGYLFTYNKNMEELNENEDETTLITQIVPVTSYNEKRIMLPELTVDSSYINMYDEIITKEINFTLDEEDRELTNDEIYKQLREKAKEYFKETECDIVKVSYALKAKDIINNPKYKELKRFYEKLNTGDSIYVLKKNGLRLKLRVREYNYNSKELTFESLTINNTFKSMSSNVTNTGNKLDNILNTNGTVDVSKFEGIIDAMKTKFSAMRDIAQPSHVKAMIFEDRVKDSKTYGALCLGSMGFMIANERTEDDRDWNWRTFGSGQGFTADYITAGILTAILIQSIDGGCSINLETGEVNFNKGIIRGLNSFWDLNRGIFNSGGRTSSGQVRGIEINEGELYSDNVLEIRGKGGSMNISVSNKDDGSSLWMGVDNNGTGVSNDIVCTKRDVNLNKNVHCSYNLNVMDNLEVSGNKNCLQQTKEYGRVPFYANEDINSLLTKTPIDEILETTLQDTGNYKCMVKISNMIRECINTDMPYTVWITKLGQGDIWVANTYPGYFVVESDRPVRFKYKLEGRRKGFEEMNEELVFKKAYETKIKGGNEIA